MHGVTSVEHGLITIMVVVLHLLLLWIGPRSTSRPSNAERRLWRRFVGLLFLVLVMFANTALVIPRGFERAVALVAILLLALIYVDWRHRTTKLKHQEVDLDG